MQKSLPLFLFLASLILFTIGLSQQEITGFDSRFYLFVQEMSHHGMSFFPQSYHHPYPDYPATSTLVIHLFSFLFGTLNKFVAVLPTAVAAALTVTLTYLIGSLHNKHWGFCAAMLVLLTSAFLKSARSISLDMVPAVITALCFYLVYSADKLRRHKRILWIYPLILLGFAFRGPIGLVIPTGVVCAYYLVSQQYKKFFIHGVMAFLLLVSCTILLLALASYTGGNAFLHEVMRMEVLGRIDNYYLPRYFYFTASFKDYALAYPLAWLVLGGAIFYGIKREHFPDKFILLQLFAWVMVILLGMSVPDDKKIRYVLAMVPAIALIAAYPFAAASTQRYFVFLRVCLRWVFLLMPVIFLIAVFFIQSLLPVRIPSRIIMIVFVIMQVVNGIAIFCTRDKVIHEKIGMSVAALCFVMAYIMIVEPVQLYIERARDFVITLEKNRMQQKAELVFYRELPDGLPIKYLVYKTAEDEPVFIQDKHVLQNFSEPAYFVTSENYFAALPQDIAGQFHVIAKNKLGHVPVVVFVKKQKETMMNKLCIRCFVSGKVQGVWFRASTQKQAERLHLSGYARNLPDGRVEVLACGNRESLAELHEWLKQGPELAKVTELSYEELSFQEITGFETQ